MDAPCIAAALAAVADREPWIVVAHDVASSIREHRARNTANMFLTNLFLTNMFV